MISFPNHIIFDRKDTWPQEVLDLLDSNKVSIQGFFREEHRIDALARKDMHIRYNRPQNIFKETFDNTIAIIEEALKKYSIVGIHCTKLLDEEINNIKQNGLNPLNKTFANQRIEYVYNQDLISETLRNELINKKELDANNRRGMIWVFHCLSTLKFESGLNRLFGYWGGESLYAYAKHRNELRAIGNSCIVFTTIEIKELDIYPELSKRMTSFYFDDNYFPHDTDSIIRSNLKVLKIIKRNEKIFEKLTNIQDWDDEIE
jgi:hypothetical protein